MADRTVSYVFKGNFTSLTGGLAVAGKSVGDFGNKLTALDKNGAKARAGLKSVGDTAGKMGLVAAAGLGAMVIASANFDRAMSNVRAATHESAENMDALRKAALKAGADTVFSATEAADAVTALAKAGVSTKDVLGGGLGGALALASAGELDVAQAADIAATAMNQFGLAGKDIPHIADLLAAAAGKAQGEVTDMANALKYVGPVAAQMGISIEETAGSIAELAAQGILGDQAGTALRGMLTALTSPSKMAAKEMEKLKISMYDASGQFVGIEGIAGQLHKTMTKLTAAERDQALGRIFGNEQITAARILYAGGAAEIQKWTAAVDDQGFAAETAGIKLDNLSGDVEAFKGSLETALIGSGSGSQGALRGLVQELTGVVNAFNELPPAAQGSVSNVLVATAALGGGLFVFSRATQSIASTRLAMEQLGITATKTQIAMRAGAGGIGVLALSMNTLDDSSSQAVSALGEVLNVAGAAAIGFSVGGPFGAAIGGGIAAIHGLVGALNDSDEASRAAAEGAKQYGGTLDKTTGQVTGLTRELIAQRLEQQGILELLSDVGVDSGVFVSAILGKPGAIKRATDELAPLKAELISLTEIANHPPAEELGSVAEARQRRIDDLGKIITAYDVETGAVKDSAAARIREAVATDKVSGAVGGLTTAQGRNVAMTEEQTKALEASRDAASDTANRFVNLGNSVNKAKVSLGGWLKDLEKQADALRNFRENAETAAKKGLQEGLIRALQEAGPEGALRMKQLANATDAEIERANKAWKRGQREIRLYTNAVGGVPPVVSTNLRITGAQAARAALASIIALANQVPRAIRTEYIVNQLNATNKPRVPSADGSTVPKSGRGYADRYEYLLADGEEVISNRYGQADRWRPLLKAINAGRLADGGTARVYGSSSVSDIGRYMSQPTSSMSEERLVALIAQHVRPVFGPVSMQPHNYNEFKREMGQGMRAAQSGGIPG